MNRPHFHLRLLAHSLDAATQSVGPPRRRRKYRAMTTVGILVVGLLLVALL